MRRGRLNSLLHRKRSTKVILISACCNMSICQVSQEVDKQSPCVASVSKGWGSGTSRKQKPWKSTKIYKCVHCYFIYSMLLSAHIITFLKQIPRFRYQYNTLIFYFPPLPLILLCYLFRYFIHPPPLTFPRPLKRWDRPTSKNFTGQSLEGLQSTQGRCTL